jgi:hypothetical protein
VNPPEQRLFAVADDISVCSHGQNLFSWMKWVMGMLNSRLGFPYMTDHMERQSATKTMLGSWERHAREKISRIATIAYSAASANQLYSNHS